MLPITSPMSVSAHACMYVVSDVIDVLYSTVCMDMLAVLYCMYGYANCTVCMYGYASSVSV